MKQAIRFLLTIFIVAGSACIETFDTHAQARSERPTAAFARTADIVTRAGGEIIVPIRLSHSLSDDAEFSVAVRGGTAAVDEEVSVEITPTPLALEAGTASSRVVLTVNVNEQRNALGFLDLVLQSEDVSIGEADTFRLWIRNEAFYEGPIARALTDLLRADFAPETVLATSAVSDSLIRAVWSEGGMVQGAFGEQARADASTAKDRESGLVVGHVWPGLQEGAPSQRDLHALMPMDRNMRAKHQALQRAEGETSGEASGDATYLTPDEDLRGDVARALLYFHAMYPEQADSDALATMKSTLARWIDEDPVDERELERTTRIARYQGQPNPFVLVPDLAEAAFNLRGTYSTPTVSFTARSTTASESDSAAVLEVVARDVGRDPVTLTVGFDARASTADSEDLGGFRYRTVSFPADTPDGTVRRVRVPIVSDEVDEDTERATFMLENASGFTQLGEVVRHTLDISNVRPNENEPEGRIVLGPAYPNPLSPGRGSTVRLEVRMDEAVPFTVEVFSTLGQRVHAQSYSAGEAERLSEITIDASDLPSGLYIVRLQGASFRTTETFVVVR